MLSKLQTNKLERFFYILDFDRNGVIEEEDFLAIAENLCVLWGLREDSDEYKKLLNKFSEGWSKFNYFVNNNDEKANWDHLVEFTDKVIINGDQELFGAYVDEFAGEIFDNFDADKDGYISLEEFIDLFCAYRIEIRYAAKAFRKIDLNHDELISRGELISAVKEFFRSDDEESPGNWLFGNF